MAYMRTTGNSGSSNENDFIMKQGAKHWRYSLRKEGATEIRVVPVLNPDGTTEALIDKNRGNDVFSQVTNALAFYDVVTFLGPGKVHMVCPMVEGESVGPVQTLINTIKNATKNDPKGCDDNWLSWCGMGPYSKDVMSKPASTLMLQGYLYMHKGVVQVDKEGKQSPRYPVVLQVGRSASNELCDKLTKVANPNAEWGSMNNLLGDFIDPQNGRTLLFTPYQKNYNNNIQTWYHADLGQAAIPLSMDDIAAVWKPWDDVIDGNPTLPEVGARLAKAFNATTVIKVFENHPTYVKCITDGIRAIADREAAAAVGRVQTGYTQAYGTGSYPPYPQQGYQPQAQPAAEYPPRPVAPSVQPQAAPQPQTPYYAPPQTQQAQPVPPPYVPPAGLGDDGEDDEPAATPFDANGGNVSFNRRPRR